MAGNRWQEPTSIIIFMGSELPTRASRESFCNPFMPAICTPSPPNPCHFYSPSPPCLPPSSSSTVLTSPAVKGRDC